TDSGDELSLALGIAGRVTELMEGRVAQSQQSQEARALVNELTTLFDRIGGTASERTEILTAVALAQYGHGELTSARDTLARLPRVSDGAGGSSMATARTLAGVLKVFCGQREAGQHDIRVGIRLAKESDPLTLSRTIGYRMDLVVEG